ncbi:DUF805 domain-containing protein [Nocardioides sp. T2.26MG-1]|uniref:DUF805 domain-containing protein n=1 Tax=Nocardioides sp. T2.26MG-1 TaxID=3041166 RepID=UPI002477662F|nr:DUF805 domain-containing protein [Nocardioides sp. T2.26MG-1]CAI9411195.1 Inner membrane protein YhaH [Nocardioides sp. T2.26MG-1]
MSFSDAVSTCLGKYADFSGRAGRPEFWWFFVFNVAASLMASIVDGLAGTDVTSTPLTGDQGLVGILVTLALVVPNLSVGARRLHDTGRPAWWLLLLLVPCLGILVLIVFFCLPSQPHPNRYGEPPLQTGAGR